MEIRKCKNCGTEFKYKNLLRALLGNYLECKNCGKHHEMTLGSRFALSALIIFPVFIKNRIQSELPNLLLVYLVYSVYLVIILALSPYIFKYKLKDSN